MKYRAETTNGGGVTFSHTTHIRSGPVQTTQHSRQSRDAGVEYVSQLECIMDTIVGAEESELEELLNSWGLAELLPRFVDRKITDVAALRLITPAHAKRLFDDNEFGWELKFFEKLESWKQETFGRTIVIAVEPTASAWSNSQPSVSILSHNANRFLVLSLRFVDHR
ncbi:uncharacterized protein LOC127752303 [Frankliniella occidentalis]|uniref:Uncharacterized protein LOC127752303 n=1 Tax=Frankliniella occidentalis TaxID=133901 RepID=A0A9C6XC11_FRAOC|nr:uncharacterized protein LOC127752303 [Frankliniella occidentalis]